MPLPYKVKDLEAVPESARELYEKKGDEFVLQVEGVEGAESVGELRRALERVRVERDTFKRRAGSVKDEDLTELETLRQEKLERDENKLLWEEPLKGEPKLLVEGEAVRNLDELPGIGQVTERRINERLSEEGDG